MRARSEVAEALSRGGLEQAVASAKALVISSPGEIKARISLFELFAILQDWERARAQLRVIERLGQRDFALTFSHLSQGEEFRRRVFLGEEVPCMPDTINKPSWFDIFVEGFNASFSGDIGRASSLRQQALELCVPSSGTINGERFRQLGDGDGRLGPCIECFWSGAYHWLPTESIRSICFHEVRTVRDLVWRPADLETREGMTVRVFLPVRFVEIGIPPVRCDLLLSRVTEWDENHGVGGQIGRGQKVLSTESKDYPVLELSQVTVDLSQYQRFADTRNPADE